MSPEIAPLSEGAKRRQERDSRLLEEKKAAMTEQRSMAKKIREELKERTLKRIAEKEAADKELLELTRSARAEGGFYKPAEPKVAFVIRLKGVNKMAPKPRKAFQLFRLLQIHNGVFIKINKATQAMLKLIEPFVTYGYPTEETIRRLVYKRGYLRVGPEGARQRVRLQDNEAISAKLGHLGIHGAEDLIHEIATAGPHFKEATNFLWTFKLKPPRGGYLCKRHGFAEFRKGDWGNREGKINSLVRKMI